MEFEGRPRTPFADYDEKNAIEISLASPTPSPPPDLDLTPPPYALDIPDLTQDDEGVAPTRRKRAPLPVSQSKRRRDDAAMDADGSPPASSQRSGPSGRRAYVLVPSRSTVVSSDADAGPGTCTRTRPLKLDRRQRALCRTMSASGVTRQELAVYFRCDPSTIGTVLRNLYMHPDNVDSDDEHLTSAQRREWLRGGSSYRTSSAATSSDEMEPPAPPSSNKNGTQPSPNKNGNVQLLDRASRALLRLLRAENWTDMQLARELGCSKSTITRALNRYSASDDPADDFELVSEAQRKKYSLNPVYPTPPTEEEVPCQNGRQSKLSRGQRALCRFMHRSGHSKSAIQQHFGCSSVSILTTISNGYVQADNLESDDEHISEEDKRCYGRETSSGSAPAGSDSRPSAKKPRLSASASGRQPVAASQGAEHVRGDQAAEHPGEWGSARDAARPPPVPAGAAPPRRRPMAPTSAGPVDTAQSLRTVLASHDPPLDGYLPMLQELGEIETPRELKIAVEFTGDNFERFWGPIQQRIAKRVHFFALLELGKRL